MKGISKNEMVVLMKVPFSKTPFVKNRAKNSEPFNDTLNKIWEWSYEINNNFDYI